jgi:exodeoxyribonuclease-3
VRIATWNVNSLKARLPRLVQLLAEHEPDIACVQETKVTADAFPHLELAAAGYQAVEHSAGRWAGVAILVRQGLELSEPADGLAGVPPGSGGRWLEARLGGLRLATAYVPNGRELESDAFEEKLVFMDAMADRVKALAGEPLVLAGDLNVCPTDLDAWDPTQTANGTHVTEDERSRFRRLLEAGLVDSFRHLHPTEAAYTWWDYRAGHYGRRMGLRIDMVLVSSALADGVEEAWVDRAYRKGDRPSDHAPLLVDISLEA